MFRNHRIIKLLSLNSLSVFIKLLGGFVSVKAIAYFLGPGAMALLGNFKNFITTTQRVSTLGFQSGIVKYVSEFEDDLEKRSQLFCTSLVSTGLLSVILGSSILMASSSISDYIFYSQEYVAIIRLFGAVLPFYVIHVTILNVLNGLKRFKVFIRISILASIFAMIFSVFLIWKARIFGALLSIATVEAIVVLFSIGQLRNIGVRFYKKYFSKSLLKKLFAFSTMALFTAILDPSANLFLRKLIISEFNLFEAGIWEGINKLSNYYLLFVTSSLSLYYFPKLAETKSIVTFKSIVKKYYRFVLPILLLGGTVLYFGRHIFIHLLFGEDFESMECYFLPRVIGDTFKILSYALSYQFLAKRMLTMYIVSELIFFISYTLAALLLIDSFGVLGVVYAYAVAYFIYWLLVLIFFADKFRKRSMD